MVTSRDYAIPRQLVFYFCCFVLGGFGVTLNTTVFDWLVLACVLEIEPRALLLLDKYTITGYIPSPIIIIFYFLAFETVSHCVAKTRLVCKLISDLLPVSALSWYSEFRWNLSIFRYFCRGCVMFTYAQGLFEILKKIVVCCILFLFLFICFVLLCFSRQGFSV